MILRRLLLLLNIVAFIGIGRLEAQQDPQFSQNMNNKLFVNPAYAGSGGQLCAYLLGRQQWVGFEGRPETYLFGVHGSFTTPLINLKSGAGLTLLSDGLGQERTFGVKAMYAVHIPLNIMSGDALGIGLSIGMLQKSFGTNWRAVHDPWTDPTIPLNGFKSSGIDADFGLYYHTHQLYFGLSGTHLLQTALSGEGPGLTGEFPTDSSIVPWTTVYTAKPHFYAMAGYDYVLPNNPLIVLKPSVFFKTELSSAQVDVNLSAEYNRMFWGGLTYRLQDAVIPMVGINYEPAIIPGIVRFGYAYDVTTNALRTGSSNSHEIFLRYCLTLRKPAPVSRHKSVRFL